MRNNDNPPSPTDSGTLARKPGLLDKLLTFAVGAVLLFALFMFSLLAFAVLITGGLLFLGYLWWKTRELRKRMREQPPGGLVIEGKAIRDDGNREGEPH